MGCLLRLYGNGGKNVLLYTICSAKNVFLLFSILLILLGSIKCSESLYLLEEGENSGTAEYSYENLMNELDEELG